MTLPRFSAYGGASLEPAPVNAMMAAFAADFRPGTDINLGVGYVNEDTMPREQLKDALDAVLSQPARYPFALNYGDARGTANLQRALRRLHGEVLPDGVTPAVLARRQILVGANGATSLLEGLAQVLAPGIVITSDPLYYIYGHYLRRIGHEVLAVPEDEHGLQVDGVRTLLGQLGARRSAISFLYAVGVGNPSGTILTNQRRRELVEVAAALSRDLGRIVPLVLDRAYDLLVHDPAVEQPVSMAALDTSGVVYEIGTLSKVLAPALRIGYLIGPPGPLCDALSQRTSDIGFSAPVLNQEIAAHLLDHCLAAQQQRVNQGYRRKAQQVAAALQADLGPAVTDCRGGHAGFYFYLTLDGVSTAPGAPFYRFLSRTTGDPAIDGRAGQPHPRVIYIPGAFCVSPQGSMVDRGQRQLRISYGFEPTEAIQQAVGLMAQAAAWARTQSQA